MARLFHYRQQAQDRVAIPQASSPPPADMAGATILKTAIDAGVKGLEFVARDYSRYQSGLAEEALARVDRQFEEWKSEYMRENQGKDATLAQRDFTQMHDKLAQEALKDYDAPEYTVFRDDLKKRLAARSLAAFKDGGHYQRQQTQIWEKSVWDGSLAQFAQDIAAHADDPDRLEYLAKEKLALWQRQNPGKDDTDARIKLEKVLTEGRVNAFIAQQRWDEAEAALGVAASSPAHQPTATQPGQGSGTIAEDLHNPGNLKIPGHNGGARSDYQNFASDEDGWRGMAAQLARYQTKYGLKTARQMVQRWAPASDGNNHKTYFATMQKYGLKDLDAPIDVSDKRQLAILCKAMSMAESPLGARYSVEQIEQALSENGGEARTVAPWSTQPVAATQPVSSSLDPARVMQFQAKIAAGRNQQQEGLRSAAALQFADYKAQCLEGIIPDTAPTPENFAVFGKEAPAKYLEAQAHYEYGALWSAMKTLPPEAHGALLQRMKPQQGMAGYAERRELWKKLEAQANTMRKELASNPIKWLAANDQTVSEAREKFFSQGGFTRENFEAYYQATQAAQKLRGILEPRIFSSEDAARLGDLYAAQRDPTAYTYEFAQAFGSMHGKAMQEIMPHMPAASAFIASGMEPNAARLLMQFNTDIKKDKSFLPRVYENLNLKGTEKTAFQTKIFEVMKPAMQSFIGGVDDKFATGAREETEKLALAYMRRGYDQDAAIKKASEAVLLDRYVFAGNPNAANATVRIPANQDSERIIDGLRAYLQTADISGFYLQYGQHRNRETEKSNYEDMIRHQGCFVTNSDETGCCLYVGPIPVYDKDGNMVNIPWEQLAALGNQYNPNDPDTDWD